MLACGDERNPFGAPLCAHLRAADAPINYVIWYTGSGLDAELLCLGCASERENGRPVDAGPVCEVCFSTAKEEAGQAVGTRGAPGILSRPAPFDAPLRETPLPTEAGAIADIAPVNGQRRSIWLLLAADGGLIRLDAGTGEWGRFGVATVPTEADHEPWAGHVLRRRLHVSPHGDLAAVVNDYGRYGQLIDLRSGRATFALDGGDYLQGTVPFSFAFAAVGGRLVAIHRTAWNRLDLSDPVSGALLSDRDPTSYRRGEAPPAHYLDYFHGALSVSPRGTQILDDGWVWAPSGIPRVWSLERWLAENVWESEDGPTTRDLCLRAYYWGQALTWIDEGRVAVGGIGDDDEAMIDGARVFDITSRDGAADPGRPKRPWVRELTAFAGPAGDFFSDGTWLYSTGVEGLSRWNLEDGARTGQIPAFRPTHHHRGAGELAQLRDGVLVRRYISG